MPMPMIAMGCDVAMDGVAIVRMRCGRMLHLETRWLGIKPRNYKGIVKVVKVVNISVVRNRSLFFREREQRELVSVQWYPRSSPTLKTGYYPAKMIRAAPTVERDL